MSATLLNTNSAGFCEPSPFLKRPDRISVGAIAQSTQKMPKMCGSVIVVVKLRAAGPRSWF